MSGTGTGGWAGRTGAATLVGVGDGTAVVRQDGGVRFLLLSCSDRIGVEAKTGGGTSSFGMRKVGAAG